MGGLEMEEKPRKEGFCPQTDLEGIKTLQAVLRKVAGNFDLLERWEVACCGITVGQCHLLRAVAVKPGLSLGELAQRLGVDASTASRITESLVQMGAIQRHPVPGNRRTVALALTGKGQAMLAALEAEEERFFTRLWAALPLRQRKTIVAALTALLAALEAMEASCCFPWQKGWEKHARQEGWAANSQ